MKFYLIDPSLCGAGGHHGQYARLILAAAEQYGAEPVVASHQEYRDDQSPWPVHPVFPDRIYDDPLLIADKGLSGRLAKQGSRFGLVVDRLVAMRFASRRRALIARMSHATARLFNEAPAARGDHAFWATSSELTVQALAEFLRTAPSAPPVDWRLLFHFNFLAGRPTAWNAQHSRIARMRRSLEALRQRAPRERLHFYTTTEQLAEQFNRLDCGTFRLLPYPIDPEVRSALAPRPTESPLSILYAGDARIEKRFHHLPGVVDSVQRELLDSGKARFDVQANFSFRLPCRKRNLPLVEARERLERLADRGVRLVERPLSTDEYLRRLGAADVGLAPYDGEHYYARCSGVLVELLGAATPSIVPSDGWMGRQLADENRRHAAALCRRLPIVESKFLADLHCAVRRVAPQGVEGDRLSFGKGNRAAVWRMNVPDGATHLAVRFRWIAPLDDDPAARLCVEIDSADGAPIARRNSTLRPGDDGRSIGVIRLAGAEGRVRLRWENAYDDRPIALEDVRIDFHSALGVGDGDFPTGRVGLTADDDQQVAEQLREIVRFHDHYRQTALAFAEQWIASRDPRRIVAQLLQSAPSESRRDPPHRPARKPRATAAGKTRRAS